MFLRDYLYVDLDKVSGLASQLYDGVPDRATRVTARQEKLEADIKVIRKDSGSKSGDAVESTLRDSLFNDLETDLECLGLLTDVSTELANVESWDSVGSLFAPGQLLRITAPGTLFHPAQMSDAIVGLATAASGLAELGIAQPGASAPRLYHASPSEVTGTEATRT